MKFSNFIRFRRFASGCCCEVIRSFFSEVFVWFLSNFHILITSRTYRSFSFVYLFVMKFILSFMARLSLSLYLNAKIATTATMLTIRWRRKCQEGEERNVIRKSFKRKKKKFLVTKLLCCHVDGEKLCVPYFQEL